MRNIDIALDLHTAGIPVAGVDQAGAVKVPATTDRRAICAAFRDGEPLIPAAVAGNGLAAIRFQNDECYRRTIADTKARDGSLFNLLAVMRTPSARWIVLVRVQGGAAPAGEVLARDKAGKVLVGLLADGDLVVFGGQDAPVWRQGGVKSIPTLPLASVEILLAAGRKVNEWGEPDETNIISAPVTEAATAEAAPAPETVEAPQAEAMLDHALRYARRGWPVFPCGTDKSPLIATGFKAATTDEEQIRSWWTRYQDASIGVPTGPALGAWVLDVDLPKAPGEPDGRDTLAALETKHEALPPTVEQHTGSGGRQLFFRWQADGPEIKNTSGKIGPKLDTRGAGGYVIVPPSGHPSGGRYAWISNGTDLAEAPSWLAELVLAKPSPARPVERQTPTRTATGYGRAALDAEVGKVAAAPSGQRNGTLNAAAYSLGQLVAGGVLDQGEVESALLDAANAAGLSDGEARATIRSGMGAGEKEPRTAPEPAKKSISSDCDSDTCDNCDSWQEPEPLSVDTASQPYPLDALPPKIHAAVVAVIGYVQCPPALAAMSALSVLSLVGQGIADVRRGPRLNGPCSLFLIGLGQSGERKTTADDAFSHPIRQWQLHKQEDASPTVIAHVADMRCWEAERRGVEESIKVAAKAGKPTDELRARMRRIESDKPQAPRVPRLFYSDVTIERLRVKLAELWPSAGLVTAEGGVVFGAHAMNADNIMRTLAAINVLWDGGRLEVDRVTNGDLLVECARLTVSLFVQPEVIEKFMDKNAALARGSGWLARALLAHPESTQGFRPFKEPPHDCPPLAAFHARLSQMLDAMPKPNAAGGLDLPKIDLSPEAKQTWVEFYNAIEVELRAGGEFADVKDVASKTADNAARIACLFHLFDSGPHGQISEPHMVGAAAIAAWHLYEARRFFGEIALPPELSAAAKLDEWLQRFCRTNNVKAVPKRDVSRLGPYRVRTEKAFKAALDVLRGLNRVRVVRDGKRRLVQVNPALLGGDR